MYNSTLQRDNTIYKKKYNNLPMTLLRSIKVDSIVYRFSKKTNNIGWFVTRYTITMYSTLL